jgi:folate-binding protein YgfZ
MTRRDREQAVTSFDRPGAVPAPEDDPDHGVPWHYGDPHREQRLLHEGSAAVDISNRGVVSITGPDRLTWLHSLTTQQLDGLAAGASRLALILSPHGHVEHELHLVDDGATTWLVVQPGTAPALVAYLSSMRFMLRVEVADRSDELGVVWEPTWLPDAAQPTWLVPADFAGQGHVDSGADRGGDSSKYVAGRPATFAGREVIVPLAGMAARLDAAGAVAGSWALEALRVAAAVPRLGLETDHRTLPHEVGWIGPGVHLAKGCYRGQEAVARVHNLGHPPRRLVLLHLDGSEGHLPRHGDIVSVEGREAGWVGTAARHFELGPIATALVRRSTPTGATATVTTSDGDVPATQETVVLP